MNQFVILFSILNPIRNEQCVACYLEILYVERKFIMAPIDNRKTRDNVNIAGRQYET